MGNANLLIAFGANLPFNAQTPADTIRLSLEALAAEGFRLGALSRIWQTPCFPAGAGPDYANAAAVMTAPGYRDVSEILAALHRVEAKFGRERAVRWGGRTLDIDLIAAGDSVLPDEATQDRWRNIPSELQAKEAPSQLILPHPRMQDRAFVLVPLAEVAADWVHPRLGLSVAEMLAALPLAARDEVRPL